MSTVKTTCDNCGTEVGQFGCKKILSCESCEVGFCEDCFEVHNYHGDDDT